MEQSMTLMSAQIHFVEAQLSLIHIPLAQYHHFLQPILKLLFPKATHDASASADSTRSFEATVSWANRHPFLNVSITPIECSIVCSKDLAQSLFLPVLSQASRAAVEPGCATISSEDFVVISVVGEGLEAGQRVLELTSPLALAGISIFFITTYFSDYILVPAKSRGQVIGALEDRGFAFEKNAEAYINPAAHRRQTSSTSSLSTGSPSTPPPTTVSELQTRTFALLKRHHISPQVDVDVRLVQCAGLPGQPGKVSKDELGLQLGIIKCLVHHPKFLSLTLTEDEPASLLLEKRLVSDFGDGRDVLVGSMEDYLKPIILDLEPLPLEATGIVCGVASKLVGRAGGHLIETIDMSYLSTARAGTVMVNEKVLEQAMEALGVEETGAVGH